MKKTTILILFTCIGFMANAQFEPLYRQGMQQQKAGKYYPAIKSYTAAIGFTIDKTQIAKANKQIDFCANKLQNLTADALKAKAKAENLANGVLELLKRSLPAGVTDVYAYYKQQADTAYAQGHYNDAIGFYQGAKLLASTTAKQQQLQGQINNAQQCIKLINQAGQYAFVLDLQKAIATYKKLQQLNPTDPTAAWRIEAFSRPETLTMLKQLKLVTVKGGSFMMGGEFTKPIHKVILTDYQVATYEITNAQYAEFLNKYGSTEVQEGEYKGQSMINLDGSYENVKCRVELQNGKYTVENGYENHPIVKVTWYGAYAFCRHYGLNLPTEAQWEYAARGGKQSKGYKYAGSNEVGEVAWYNDNSDRKTHKVGQKKENELKLYDMSGNVSEWCSDWFGSGYYSESPEKNPQGPQGGFFRVRRGGSWRFSVLICRVANHEDLLPNYELSYLGFRAAFVP